MQRLSSPLLCRAVRICRSGAVALMLLSGSACRPPSAVAPLPGPSAGVQRNELPAPSDEETRARLAAEAELAPEKPAPALRLALFDRDHGAVPQAEQELQAIRRRFPDSAEASFQLGTLYVNAGNAAEAAAPLRDAAQHEPGRADIQVMAALACFRLSRYGEAERYARAALKADPNSAAAWLLLARIYSNSGSAAQSRSAIQEYLKRATDPAPGRYLLARMYYRQADAPNAERALRTALQAHPEEGDYWALLGHVYGDLNNGARLTEAVTCYKKALELKPRDAETHAALGRALMREQQWEQAVAELRTAIRNAPDPGPLLYSLGRSLLRAGHAEEGNAVLVQYQAYQEYIRGAAQRKGAVQANPKDCASRYALVRFCLHFRQYGAAKAALDAADLSCRKETAWQQLNRDVSAALSQPEAPSP